MIFVGILNGDQPKQKRFDLVSCKIFLLVYTETCGPKAGFGQSCFRQNFTNFRVFSGLFLASNLFWRLGRVWAYAFWFGSVPVGPFTTLHYKHFKEIYVICILIEITSLRLSKVVLFLFFIFLNMHSFSMSRTLPITAFLVLLYLASLAQNNHNFRLMMKHGVHSQNQ